MSKAALSRTIMDFESALPKPNNYPKNYLQARSLLSPFLLATLRYDSCTNDCVLFRDHSDGRNYANLKRCPITSCQEKRYTRVFSNGQHTPARKSVTYIGIKGKLMQIFGECNIAKLIFAGDLEMKNPDKLNDICDGLQWKKWFAEGGVFGETGPGGAVPLGLTTDGLNPNRNVNLKRSIWPVFCTFLTMKGRYRNLLGVGLLLVTIIAGWRGKEPKSLEPVLELLVDELLSLLDTKIYNSYVNAPVKIKLTVLYFCCDFPANAKLFHTAGQAALRACPFCDECGTYIKKLHKCVHLSNRRYLDQNNPMRKADRRFPIQDTEDTSPPCPIDPNDEAKYRSEYDTLQRVTHRKSKLKETGFMGHYVLERLPGHIRQSQSVADGMHTCADVISNMHKVISGQLDEKVIRYEMEIGRISMPANTASASSNASTIPKQNSSNQRVKSKNKKRGKTGNKRAPKKCAQVSADVQIQKGPWELDKTSISLADIRAQSIDYPYSSPLRAGPFFSNPGSLDKMHLNIKVCIIILNSK